MNFHFVCGAEICMAEKHGWYISAVHGLTPILIVLGKVSENYNTKMATNNLIII
jgi:hypothetical protein